MSDLEYWIGVVVPRLIGVVLIAYSLFLVYRARAQFFMVVRGLVVASFIVAVALLWIYETSMSLAAGDWSHHVIVSISFVVVASWLSVWVVAITTRYRRYLDASAFKKLIFARPVSPITVWGMIGILILVASMAVRPVSDEDLRREAWLLAVVLVYMVASIVFNLIMPILAKRRGELRKLTPEERRSVILLAGAWIGMPVAQYLFDLYLRATTDVNFDAAHSWTFLVMFAILLKSVTSRRFSALVVEAEVEMTERGGFRPYDIPRGVYLFEDETSKSAANLFVELVTLPLRPDVVIPEKESATSDTLAFLIPKGLMVTRVFPERIREEYHLQVTPIIWLTESTGDRRIPPTSIALLTDALIRFMEGNPNSIVLVDGVEYLLTFNDFNRVLRSLDSLNETTWITKSRLIIAINPEAFDSKQVAMLERDRIVINGEEGLEELKNSSKKLALQE